MNLILVYGLGLVSALNKITSLKKDFDPLSVVEINAKSLTSKQALVEILTPSLFSEKRLVILDEPDEKIDLSFLGDDPNLTLVLKISKNLTANSLILQQARKKGAQIIQTSEEKETSIFPYLDMMAEKNPQALLEQEKLLNEFGGQYILTMLFYLLRRFILPSKTASVFMLQKIAKQRKNFPTQTITKFYQELLETDFKIKKGLIDEAVGIRAITYKILQ